MYNDLRLPPLVVQHLNFAEAQAITPADAQSLERGLLGRVPHRVVLGLSGFAFAVFDFFFREDGFKVLPPPGSQLPDPGHLDDVRSDAEDHANTPYGACEIGPSLKRAITTLFVLS